MNWKKSIAVALSAIAVMAMVAGCGSNTATNDQKKIGVIQLVEHPSLDAANKGFVDGLAAKGYKIIELNTGYLGWIEAKK